MDTSLAEDVQQAAKTTASDQFFFMSPFRSFMTSGCFARISEPAVEGDSPDSAFQRKLAQAFADAKTRGIANPVVVGAIPFDTTQPSELFIPASGRPFRARLSSAPPAISPGTTCLTSPDVRKFRRRMSLWIWLLVGPR